MILPQVILDPSEFDVSLNEVKAIFKGVISDAAVIFLDNLEVLVNTELSSTRKLYINSIILDDSDEEIVIKLSEENLLVKSIEKGTPAYDMKPGLLNGPNAKVNEKGVRYNTVPFSFKTPGSRTGSNVLPNKVYRDVLKKELNPITNKTKPLAQSEIKEPFNAIRVRKEITTNNTVYPEYTHKASIYAGLTRIVDDNARGKYYTWRRVSDNSDSNAFIHPGFEPKNFFERALEQIDLQKVAEDSLNNKMNLL